MTAPPKPVDSVTVESSQPPQHAIEVAILIRNEAAGLTIRCVPDEAVANFWRVQIIKGNRAQLLKVLALLPGVTVVEEISAADLIADGEEPKKALPPDGVEVDLDDL